MFDKTTRYRQSTTIRNLELRARCLRSIRKYFTDHDFLEVETPYRIPSPAPEANIDVWEAEGWFLHASPELCMKRLLAAQYPRLFQICRCFRKEERGRKHLPEFTMLEWYAAGWDYRDMMGQTEDLIRIVADDLDIVDLLVYQDEAIDLKGPWKRITVSAAFDIYGAITIAEALSTNRFDEVMANEIEPNLGRGTPVFLYDYPSSKGSLARLKMGNPRLAERFELYICGIELCNGFSELSDSAEQKMRFEKEQKERRLSGKPVYPMPKKFLESLKDMPDSGGNALGIDRLLMLFADTTVIDDIVAFTPEEL